MQFDPYKVIWEDSKIAIQELVNEIDVLEAKIKMHLCKENLDSLVTQEPNICKTSVKHDKQINNEMMMKI